MKHMRDAVPDASFIGFTGTLIELAHPASLGMRPTDKNIGAVFGDCIIVYDIQRATSWPGYVPAVIPALGAAASAVHEAARLVRVNARA